MPPKKEKPSLETTTQIELKLKTIIPRKPQAQKPQKPKKSKFERAFVECRLFIPLSSGITTLIQEALRDD